MSEIDEEKLRAVEEKADVIIDNPKNKQILENVDNGDRVSYIGKDNLYRSGGFVLSVSREGDSMTLTTGSATWFVRTAKIATLFVVSK
jgi:RPA family protein